ncbi:hypothetical protein [Serratia fonticola]|uniref:hypothetical protein n=1 Tax=Serratia fonticola TaxID=47917 RepID=UPI00217ADBCB|nr:hypothetical protein [Serratia fonticola]CAI0833362.1 Uncharacterised protein [Serratia fonticola]CAI0956838.1 Uncharacterised protein [Serratia fonticola]
MITLSEIKKAILKINDTEIIHDDDDENKGRLKFKKNNDTFTIYSIPENTLSKTNLRLSCLIKLPKEKRITKKEGEVIESTLNLIGNTPCRIVCIYDKEDEMSEGKFFITNLYTDKLDHFKKIQNGEFKSSDIVILILAMIVEIMICTQEITAQAYNIIERRNKGEITDGE